MSGRSNGFVDGRSGWWRRNVRRLRYGVRDLVADLSPRRRVRLRSAEAFRELERRASGARDPQWRPPLPLEAPPRQMAVGLIAFYAAEPPAVEPGDAPDSGAARKTSVWNAVTRALPQFPRHVQPQLPAELGYYDPSAPATLRAQVALARQYGVSAFCFSVSLADGEARLPLPAQTLLADADLDMGFCLFLAGAVPPPEPGLPPALRRALADPRAVRVAGRPLLGIAQPALMAPGTLAAWRAAARRELGSELFLVRPFADGMADLDGFDAAVQIPPQTAPAAWTPRRIETIHPDFSGVVEDLQLAAEAALDQLRAAAVPLFPGICPGYDDTPLRGKQARIVFAPDAANTFTRWLSEIAFLAHERPVAGASLVFVNAWNDWLRGAMLEPGSHLGHAMLRAVASVLAPYAGIPARVARQPLPDETPRPARAPGRAGPDVTVLHAFYPDVLEHLLGALDTAAPLYVTTSPEAEERVRPVLARLAPRAQVRVVENRGRDVLPFLRLLPELSAEGFRHVVKLHTKRSPHHAARGTDWLDQLVRPLARIQRGGQLAATFQSHAALGLLGPAGHVLDGSIYAGVAGNTVWLRRLSRELGLGPLPPHYPYVAGTMFAARLAAFEPLAARPDLADLFEPDMGLSDGTMAHAMERFFGVLVAALEYSVGEVSIAGAGISVLPSATPLTAGYGFAAPSRCAF